MIFYYDLFFILMQTKKIIKILLFCGNDVFLELGAIDVFFRIVMDVASFTFLCFENGRLITFMKHDLSKVHYINFTLSNDGIYLILFALTASVLCHPLEFVVAAAFVCF